mmetsp:Transcript_56141/g.148259  ORF Transcript_56141/g.148259 Transcript_56141/m.148259 type:complete len:133 (-) Transcript_56141:22-420(-)
MGLCLLCSCAIVYSVPLACNAGSRKRATLRKYILHDLALTDKLLVLHLHFHKTHIFALKYDRDREQCCSKSNFESAERILNPYHIDHSSRLTRIASENHRSAEVILRDSEGMHVQFFAIPMARTHGVQTYFL